MRVIEVVGGQVPGVEAVLTAAALSSPLQRGLASSMVASLL